MAYDHKDNFSFFNYLKDLLIFSLQKIFVVSNTFVQAISYKLQDIRYKPEGVEGLEV